MPGDYFPYCRGIVRSTVRRDQDFRSTVPFEEGVHRTVAALCDEDGVRAAPTEQDRFEDCLIEAWQSVMDDVGRGIDG